MKKSKGELKVDRDGQNRFLTTLFLLFSTTYIKLVEEKEREARFGGEYKEYKRKIPFLIPKIRK